MKRLMSIILLLSVLAVPAFAEEYAVTVASPNGAPGIALALLASQQSESYTYVAAEAITAEFASEKADFIIAPVNAGAKLYRAQKSSYMLAGVVTWGNLYFASQRPDFTKESMNGADIVLFGENTINASVALYALKENGIVPASVSYLAGAANTQSLLLTDAQAIVLTAEPALTAASIKNSAVSSIALNELYEAATGFKGYAQAGLFVKKATAEQHPEAVKAYLLKAAEAVGKCESDVPAVAEACVTLGILPNQKVAENAIPRCALRFLSAAEARPQVEQTAQVDLAQFGGALPADDFYYEAP